jgi:hypothetical protein
MAVDTLAIIARMSGQATTIGWYASRFTSESDQADRVPVGHVVFKWYTDGAMRSSIVVKVYFKMSVSGQWVFHRARLKDAMGIIHAITHKKQLHQVLGIERLPQIPDAELCTNVQDIVMQYIKPSKYASSCRRCGDEMKGYPIVRVASIRNITTSMWVHARCIHTRHAEDQF